MQTIKDILRLFTPELLDRINQEVVRAGHQALKKSPEQGRNARPDSFLVETGVESPTDTGLLLRLADLDGYLTHAERQIDQVRRRVLHGETIPHAEKVFSIFQPHTVWISKGKASVPVELGLKVCVVEDQHRLILHHRVMEKNHRRPRRR